MVYIHYVSYESYVQSDGAAEHLAKLLSKRGVRYLIMCYKSLLQHASVQR